MKLLALETPVTLRKLMTFHKVTITRTPYLNVKMTPETGPFFGEWSITFSSQKGEVPFEVLFE